MMRAPLPAPATRLLMYGPPIVYCGFLWWLSDQPRSWAPEAQDKAAHALAYGVLGALWVRAFWFTTLWSLARVMTVAWTVSFGYGFLDELHQWFVPGRDASLADVVADGVGALIGTMVLGGLYAGSQRMARALGVGSGGFVGRDDR